MEPELSSLGNPYMSIHYNVEKRQYEVHIRLPDGEVLYQIISDNKLKDLKTVNKTKELELEAQLKSLQDNLTKTTEELTKAFEEKLNDERRLRTEAEKLADDLRHQVLEQGRELQRRDESNSGHTGQAIKYILESTTASISPVPRDSTSSTLPTSWTCTSNSGGTT